MEIYDTLMAQIEPDLVTTSLPYLFVNCTKQPTSDLNVRAHRYYRALLDVKRAIESYCDSVSAENANLHGYMMNLLERISVTDDHQSLRDLENQFADS